MERRRQKLLCRNPGSLSATTLAVTSICRGKPLQEGSRLFFRYICIFGSFTSTKESLNLLQWPRESSINQQLVKVKAWGGGETRNKNTAWPWWQGSDKKKWIDQYCYLLFINCFQSLATSAVILAHLVFTLWWMMRPETHVRFVFLIECIMTWIGKLFPSKEHEHISHTHQRFNPS